MVKKILKKWTHSLESK